MAARENQGYLIAVIVLVLLSLVLALVSFLGISKSFEYADNKDAAEKKLALTEKLLQANTIRSDVLKTMIGGSGLSVAEMQTHLDLLKNLVDRTSEANEKKQIKDIEDDLIASKTTYDRISKSASEGVQETTYLSVIDDLNASLAKMNTEYKIKENQATLAERDAQQKIQEMIAKAEQAEKAKEQAEQDLTAEKEGRISDSAAFQTAMNEATDRIRSTNENLEQLRQRTGKELTELRSEESRLKEANLDLAAKVIEYTSETFDRHDGQIVKVFSESQLVFVDLGRTHGLRPSQSFSVYDRSVTNFEKGKQKASIEITRVMDNQSEARITFENATDPILPGDWVLTPTWDPGQKVRFAMAGVFDLDGDGVSDLEQLKSMVERNGGEVVAWHDGTGEVQGKIDSTIRFLVLGDYPSLTVGPHSNPGIVTAMNRMKAEAEANTIQVIDQQKLIQQMGLRTYTTKMQLLDQSVRDTGFQPRTPPGDGE